jgi:hypothetical protein
MAFTPFVNEVGDVDRSISQVGENILDCLNDVGISTLRINAGVRFLAVVYVDRIRSLTLSTQV